MNMSNTAYAVATARSRVYWLLSALYLRGLTPDLLPQVTTIADLRAVLPATYDADTAAAAYQTAFGFNVFPYQSLFLDSAFLLGGEENAGVRAHYAAAGYAFDASSGEPDHIGHELGLLACLSGAEADALADGLPSAVRRARRLQQTFLDEHLLWWLPCFVAAMQRQPEPFYAAVADLTQILVMAHRRELPASAPDSAPAARLPDCPTPLDDPAAGLKEIAEFLATPVCAGIYLSREDIARLARATGLPCGFGDRRLMLTTLLRSAAEYDELGAAADGLRVIAAAFIAVYERWCGDGAPTSRVAEAWLLRVARLETLLSALVAAATAQVRQA
jgi:TorA maturation chaperone TorD